jgi:hypothetical protein
MKNKTDMISSDEKKSPAMQKFIFLSYGYETPTPEIMDAWGKWFTSIADRIVDSGGPLGSGREISRDGTKELSPDTGAATGYTIFNAKNIEEAEKIAKRCPIISSVVVHEIMSMENC